MALPYLKNALEANPSISQFWLSYIDALVKLDRISDAKAVFDQAKRNGAKGDAFDRLEKRLRPVERAQEPPKAQLQSLINLYTQGQYQEALTKALQLLKEFPNSINLYNVIGGANHSLDKLEQAIESYTKVISLKPDYAEAHYNMGNALQKQGKLEEAIEAYKKALSTKPDYADAYSNMGIALQKQGKLEEAIEAYTNALSIKPDYVKAHNNMGFVLQEQGKLEEAIEAYKKALSTKPDYADAYNNITELLKIYTPKIERSLNLFNIDGKIKKLSPRILNATTDGEIINNLLEGFNYISEDSFEYKTPLSQIYKRNKVDLKCKRHLKIFDTKDIIPEFCFGCFKVQVDVTTVIDLIKVTSLFYKLNFEEDLTRKTIIELRPNISGTYKGLIYCRGLDQAEAVKTLLDISLKEVFGEKYISKIKRGCSEYPIKFQNYGQIPKNPKDMMKFPKEWRLLEQEFDQNELIELKDTNMASLAEFCLSDFYIIQKWIDYAKGICDQSIVAFNDRPIIFTDIYEKAKIRTLS